MTTWSVFTFFCLLAFPISFISGYPSGAPDRVCGTLTPRHGESEAQTVQSPYALSVDETSIGQGDTVEVVIKSINGQDFFRGFLAVVRSADSNDDVPWGTFTSEDTNLAQVKDCLGYFNSSATHVSSDDKTQVNLQWTAPQREGNYKIL